MERLPPPAARPSRKRTTPEAFTLDSYIIRVVRDANIIGKSSACLANVQLDYLDQVVPANGPAPSSQIRPRRRSSANCRAAHPKRNRSQSGKNTAVHHTVITVCSDLDDLDLDELFYSAASGAWICYLVPTATRKGRMGLLHEAPVESLGYETVTGLLRALYGTESTIPW